MNKEKMVFVTAVQMSPRQTRRSTSNIVAVASKPRSCSCNAIVEWQTLREKTVEVLSNACNQRGRDRADIESFLPAVAFRSEANSRSGNEHAESPSLTRHNQWRRR